MNTQQRQKAIKRALIVLVLCAIPIGFRIWVESNSKDAAKITILGEVTPFLFQEHESEKIFTEVGLYDKLNILIVSNCTGNCPGVISAAMELDNWTSQNLTYEGQEKAMFSMTLLSKELLVLKSTSKNWRKILIESQNDQQEISKILPDGFQKSDNSSTLLFITGDLKIVQAVELSNVDFNNIEKTISKLSFNTYLQQYLSERTFMGPKRKVSRF